MDVEDPINPLADDAALDFGRLFSEAGVQGSFCVTGEKCRTLIARGRSDVIDALRPHALGLHTDTHSFHPTTMENLADCDYDHGIRRAMETESRGFEAFVRAFEHAPSFWGGAGNTWSCEIAVALRLLGISAYVYALSETPDNGVHRYDGIIACPQHVSIGEDAWIHGDPVADALARIAELNLPWIGVIVGHPTRFRHRAFWDAAFANGQTPSSPVQSEPCTDSEYERGKSRLREFLLRVRDRFEVVGVDALLGRLPEFRRASAEERAFFDAKTAQNLRSAKAWPIHRPDLDVEGIVSKAIDPRRAVELAVWSTHDGADIA